MNRPLLIALLVILAASEGYTQSATTGSAPPELYVAAGEAANGDVIRKDVDEVNLVFSTYDRRGRFVTDLKLQQITLRDDRRPPERVIKFTSETDLPLSAVLLIDLSDSVHKRLAFEKAAAIEFLRQALRTESDETLIVGFNSRPRIAQSWTSDKKLVARGIEGLRAQGATAFYDALSFACRELASRGRPRERRAIFVITDGDDNDSHETLKTVTSQALAAEAAVYVLLTTPRELLETSSNVSERARKLESLALATGGRMLRAFRERELAKAFASIQDELRTQYVLAYKPAEIRADGRYRAIELHAQGRWGLRFHYRRGYYSRRENGAPLP